MPNPESITPNIPPIEPEKSLEDGQQDKLHLFKLENINLPTEEMPILSGDIVTEEDKGHFSVHFDEKDKSANLSDIQIGYDGNASRGKGYGTKAYIQIGKRLLDLGYTLESTQWEKHYAEISPQALGVWRKLEKLGYAKAIGVTESKIYDRETGEEEIKEIPIYQFVDRGKKDSSD